MNESGDITQLLEDWQRGDGTAASRLLPMVYDDLRRLAKEYFRNQRDDHTLQPTALVHEVYLRLLGQRQCNWENRAQFFCVGAQAMRTLLIDHSRRKRAVKRGGDRRRLALDEIVEPARRREEYLIALDDALKDLELLDPQLVQIVELRFFAGLSMQEAAEVIGISLRTAERQWTTARAWLRSALDGEQVR